MNPNNYTIKSQEAIAQAQQLAFNAKHASLDTFHLLKAILETDKDVTPFLFKKVNADIHKINLELETLLKNQPTVSGDSMQYPSQNMGQVLLKANSYLKEFNDDYVSIEHLLLALLSINDATSKLLKQNNITETNLKQAIKELRKGQTVNNPSADTTDRKSVV